MDSINPNQPEPKRLDLDGQEAMRECRPGS